MQKMVEGGVFKSLVNYAYNWTTATQNECSAHSRSENEGINEGILQKYLAATTITKTWFNAILMTRPQ